MPLAPTAPVTIAEIWSVFQQLLCAEHIRALQASHTQRFYERVFTPWIVIWCLIYQRLHADHRCSAVVSFMASGGFDELADTHALPRSQRLASLSTSAYCQARQRLPVELLTGLLTHSAEWMRHQAAADQDWLGHPVCVVDGSTLLLWPHASLVAHYGRHQTRCGTGYWLIPRLVAAFDLHSGAVLQVADGTYATSEQQLTETLLHTAAPNSVWLGDANFGIFSLTQLLVQRRAHAVWRLQAKRAHALAKRVGLAHVLPDLDVPLLWRPSAKDRRHHPGLPHDPIPGRLLCVRIRTGTSRSRILYLFTTLTDADHYPAAEIAQLYGRRWTAELCLRSLKSTMGLERLACKSVDLVRKELYATLLAYNLVRWLMLQAAQASARPPTQLSFATCWRSIAAVWCAARPPAGSSLLLSDWLLRLAAQRIPHRPPGRVEPRACHYKPQAYPVLKKSRNQERQRLQQELAENS